MKDKNVAGILAFFLGWLGIHRFYLNQTGLGVVYLIFFWFPLIWIIAFIDAISLFVMDKDVFDLKHNRPFVDRIYGDEDTDFVRSPRRDREYTENRRDSRRRHREEREEYRTPRKSERRSRSSRSTARKKPNPYKQEGIKKFKDYDYEGAIEEFEKALKVDAQDIATHFNLACAYSLNEQADKAFQHLDKAVAFGFKDFPKIKDHDSLAYIRIQDEFEVFEQNGFRLRQMLSAPKQDLLSSQPDILEQLKKLGELKEKGLLTEKEFEAQKKKLLN